jgi:hypothetical protein
VRVEFQPESLRGSEATAEWLRVNVEAISFFRVTLGSGFLGYVLCVLTSDEQGSRLLTPSPAVGVVCAVLVFELRASHSLGGSTT